MSFELAISIPNCPFDLREAWQRAFRKHGFEIEIYPSFSREQWRRGFLPFRVTAAPDHFIGKRLDGAAIAGFEIDFSPERAHLRTAAGRSTMDFALQCIGGATLAELCGGQYTDDQNGIVCAGGEALAAAIAEITAFVASADERERTTHDFPGWEALG